MTALEQAAIDYVNERERFDSVRWSLQDRAAEQRAWRRLKREAELLSVYTETEKT